MPVSKPVKRKAGGATKAAKRAKLKRKPVPRWFFPTTTVLSIDVGMKNFAYWCGEVRANKDGGLCEWTTKECKVLNLFPAGTKSTDFNNRQCARILHDFVKTTFTREWAAKHNVGAVFIETQWQHNNRADIVALCLETNFWYTMPGVRTATTSSNNKMRLIAAQRPDLLPTKEALKAMSHSKRKTVRKEASIAYALSIYPELEDFITDNTQKLDDIADSLLQALASAKNKLKQLFPGVGPADEQPRAPAP